MKLGDLQERDSYKRSQVKAGETEIPCFVETRISQEQLMPHFLDSNLIANKPVLEKRSGFMLLSCFVHSPKIHISLLS